MMEFGRTVSRHTLIFFKHSLIHSSRNVIGSARHSSITSFGLKTALKIKWNRPEKVPRWLPQRSGDLEPFKRFDKSEIPLDYKCDAIDKLSKEDAVRRLFTLEFHNRRKENKLYIKEMEDRVRRHNYDSLSIEVRIARLTAFIRILQDQIKEQSRNVPLRVRLGELIDRRNKYLRVLRTWDYKRFEWILDKLEVEYHPPPLTPEKVERKRCVRRLTEMHCKEVKEKQLAAYKKELDELKVPFYESKLEKLKWMKEQEAKYNLESTVTDSDINNCLKKLEELKLNVPEIQKKTYIRKVDPHTLELYEP